MQCCNITGKTHPTAITLSQEKQEIRSRADHSHRGLKAPGPCQADPIDYLLIRRRQLIEHLFFFMENTWKASGPLLVGYNDRKNTNTLQKNAAFSGDWRQFPVVSEQAPSPPRHLFPHFHVGIIRGFPPPFQGSICRRPFQILNNW